MSTTAATASAAASAEAGAPAPPSAASTAMSPVQQPPPPPSPYRFSSEATPFTPSYMRAPTLPAAAAPVPPMALPEADDAAAHDDEEGDDVADGDGVAGGDDRERFSKMWMYCLQQMQGHEVGMLMDMMPPDIQDLYSDKLSDEYLLHDHEHKDRGVHALRAAHKMVQELTPEQLVNIEAFLVETDALNPNAKRGGNAGRRCADGEDGEDGEAGDDDDGEDGALFIHADDGMGSDEEEWLLEQMMAAGGKEGAAPSSNK